MSEQFLISLISLVIILALPLGLKAFSFLLKRKSKTESIVVQENVLAKETIGNFNSRFFRAINLFNVLISFCLILVPISITLRHSGLFSEWLKGMLLIISGVFLLFLAVLYVIRKSDTSWDMNQDE